MVEYFSKLILSIKMSVQKFHQHHGKNIALLENQTVAFREYSFSNGITFSEQVFLKIFNGQDKL